MLATVRGRLSLGDMTLYLVAFRQGQQSFQSILSAVGGMYEDTLYMSNLFEFLAIPVGRPRRRRRQAPAGAGRAGRARACASRASASATRAPSAGRCAGSTCSSPPGRAWRWSGENGAGKTTFIKLLTRLYEPTEGRVLLDGRDLRDWDEDELRRRIGVIFQDFNQY